MKEFISENNIEYLADYCGCSIFIKRDDRIPFSFGGNKVRIAAEIMKEIRAGGYTSLITYGSPGSNMNRAAADMAAAEGIRCYAVIKTESPEDKAAGGNEENCSHGRNSGRNGDSQDKRTAEAEGDRIYSNEELVRRSGAVIVYCTQSTVRECVEKVMLQSRQKGEKPYYVYGDSTGQGNEPVLMRASFNEYGEIRRYEMNAGVCFDNIVLTVGTGMTAGGLCAAAVSGGSKVRIVGVSAARPADRALKLIRENMLKHYGISCPDEALRITDEYLCGGYGRYDLFTEKVIGRVRKDTGICLDPVYTGKTFAGMLREAERGRIRGRILFIHTGGYPVYADWAGIRL